MTGRSFTMPIINTRFSVTWRPTAADEAQAFFNHGQSLERLKERGGLDWTELHAIIANEEYGRGRIEDLSRRCVNTILRQRAGIQK